MPPPFCPARRRFRLAAAVCLALLALARAAPPAALSPLEDSQPRPTSLHRWGALTLFHGLPSDSVRAITQDRDGVMWLGTDAGLAHYDGRRTQAESAEALAGRRVLALAFDASGALWVGTDAGAFVRAAAGGDYKAVPETAGKVVTAIHAAAPGRVLLATTDGVIFEGGAQEAGGPLAVRALAERLTTVGGRNQPLELTSLSSAGDAVLAGTRGRGLLSIRGGAVKEIPTRPRAFFVEALAQDSASGRLALGAQASGADGGLFISNSDVLIENRSSTASRSFPSKAGDAATGTVNALAFDRAGRLLAGTNERGVFIYDRDGRRLEHFTFEGTAGGLRSNRVHTVFVDREGVAWFGTNRGVCRYDPQGVRVETISEETEGNFVRSLYRTRDGRLLAGTNRGLFARDEATNSWRAVEGVGDKTIYAIAEDSSGRLLVGTASGLYAGAAATRARPFRVTPAGNEEGEKGEEGKGGKGEEQTGEGFEQAGGGSVRGVAALGGVTYLATYGRGVERLGDSPAERRLVWPIGGGDEARGREVVSLYADERAGRLWVGTANAGVFYFDGREVRAEPALSELGRSTVWNVAGSADGWLWLATARGLYAYRRGGRLVEIAPGLDARGVVSTGEGRAWCATAGAGVVRVSLDEQFGALTARLDAEQGLPSQNAFAVLVDEKTADGRTADGKTADEGAAAPVDEKTAGTAPSLLFGTTRGLARYEPGGQAPALKLTRVTASRTYTEEELGAGAHFLRLEHPQRGLALDVAATSSRTFPEQFQYAFALQDGEGRTVRQRLSHDSQFQAENLQPGRYRVVARAYTADLVPSESLAFDFEVARAPFPWRTTVLSVLLALALVTLLWAWAQHRKVVRAGRQLLEANRQLGAARLQLASEAESERRRIARDLHDQTLADLRRLLLLTDEMQRDGEAASAESRAAGASELRAEIESVSQEVRRICEDLSPSVLENVGLTAALEWALTNGVAHLPADCPLEHEFACDDRLDERLRLSPVEQMQIYRIVQEAVTNVCRHADARRVRLSVDLTGADEFLLTLEDDGRGFDPENRRAARGRGLAGIRARAAMIDAEVNWSRREGGGTRFTLRKPHAARDQPGERRATVE